MTVMPMPPEPTHPNAALADVDLTTAERHEILSAPYPRADDVPARANAKDWYGDPSGGDQKATKAVRSWEYGHMVVAAQLPGAWNNSHEPRLYVHKLMAPYLREALVRLEKAGFIHEIDTIGCFNFRRIRHSKNAEDALSWHASGVALDVNSATNFAVYERKTFQTPRHRPVGKPWSKEWRAIWPNGVSEEVVMAFEAVGFRWGGRWRGFVDPMHFELVAP